MTTAINQQEASRRTYEMAHEDSGGGSSAFGGEDFALMKVKEACADARISPATFYRLVKNDPNFPDLVKIGGGTCVRSGEWRRYLGSLAIADGADNADGFQHIAGPANRVAEQVVNAAIQRAERDGDLAMAERLRRCWRDSMKERIDGS